MLNSLSSLGTFSPSSTRRRAVPQTCRVRSINTASSSSRAWASGSIPPAVLAAVRSSSARCKTVSVRLEQLAVEGFQPLLIAGSFAGGDAFDPPRQPPGLAEQMLGLPPSIESQERRQCGPDREQLPHPVADQAALGGIVDVGLDDEGIRTHRLDGLGSQFVSRFDDQMVDLLDRLGANLGDVVADATPVEGDLFVPVADAHDLPKQYAEVEQQDSDVLLTGAVLAGSGAAIGYLISTVLGDGALYAAIGGGIGAAVGIIIGSMVSYSRMRRSMSIRAATVTLALTEKRLLIFRQSWFANRAADLLREIPTGSITSIEVGPSRFISPHPITIALDNETVLNLEAAKIEKPELLAEAFQSDHGPLTRVRLTV